MSAQNSSNYEISGDDFNGTLNGSDPSISVNVGDTLIFNVNSPGHPFYLIINSNGGFTSSNLVNNISNNGAETGTISWTPNEAGIYYYICIYHSGMMGTVTVTE